MYNFEKSFFILNSTAPMKVFEQGWRKSNSSGGWGYGIGLRVKLTEGAKMHGVPGESIWAVLKLYLFIYGSHIYVYFVCC